MKREIINDLIKWKDSPRRKPLILTGVRQCGKTYILKEFGKEHFDNVCYINFEESSQLGDIFEYDFDVNRIIKEIEYHAKTKIIASKTLLILDEIQECPRAITSLKYFCENMRELHIVCAGSLLGIALKSENIAFPVGKVNRLLMYPMSFKEFMIAKGEEELINVFSGWPYDREIPNTYDVPLKKLLKEYYFVGGMPEVVLDYIENNDLKEVEAIQNEILLDYADDFSKHAPVSEIEKIRMIWESVPKQLAKENNKFVFSHVKEGKRAHQLEDALLWLSNAGLIYKLEMISNPELPISAYADATYFKVYMSDIGLLGRRLGISYNDIANDNVLSGFKGAIVENFVMNELIAGGKTPYFWRSGNTAELDFIYEENGAVVPVEVKAAENTQAKSYRMFCKKYNVKKGYKVSLKNIAVNDCEGSVMVSLPLYLIWTI